MKRLLVGFLAISLAGCAANAGPSAPAQDEATNDPLSVIAKMTLGDLQNADADAKAHGDKIAAMCYEYLAAQLPVPSSDPNAHITGVVSAFQKGRDLSRLASAGISEEFQINCAPLLSDVRANLLRLGVLGAGAGFTGVGLP
jgi:hypothetical protein